MPKEFIKIIKLNSSEQFQFDENDRAIVLVVEDFSPEESFCEWLGYLDIPVILALKIYTSEKLVYASHLCVAAQNAKIGEHFAEEACKLRLINKVEPLENVETEALKLAGRISELAPLAIRACLKAVSEGSSIPLQDGLKIESELFAEIFSTADMREGTRAFLEKRKPVFGNK